MTIVMCQDCDEGAGRVLLLPRRWQGQGHGPPSGRPGNVASVGASGAALGWESSQNARRGSVLRAAGRSAVRGGIEAAPRSLPPVELQKLQTVGVKPRPKPLPAITLLGSGRI